MNAPALTLLYLDRHCAVVDKPGGLLAVPGRGPDKRDCVEARVRALCPRCIAQPAAHRLDMATSGLMVLGLTRESHRELSRQFAEREARKLYVALLDGEVAGNGGEIRLAFRLDPENRPHQIYDPERGKLGLTRWRKLWQKDGLTCVAFRPLTGRTHQLRLHAGHPLGLGRPIMGDALYGNARPGEPLRLHACRLAFRHPIDGRPMRFASAPPFWNAANAHFGAASNNSTNWRWPAG